MAVGDGTYVLQSLDNTYVEGGLIDLMWPSAALLVGDGGLGPRQAGRAGQPTAAGSRPCPSRARWWRWPAPSWPRSPSSTSRDRLLSAVALVAVAGRMAVAVRDNQRAARRPREAPHRRPHRAGQPSPAARGSQGVEAQASQSRPWILALFDLNGFKRYNDVYGHPAGDQLLRAWASAWPTRSGAEGRAYRLGGDEFCVLAEVDGSGAEPAQAQPRGAVRAGRGILGGRRPRRRRAAHRSSRRHRRAAAGRHAHVRDKGGGRASASVQTCEALVTALRRAGPTSSCTWRRWPSWRRRWRSSWGCRPRGAMRSAGGTAPRPGQDRHPRRDPAASPGRSTRTNGRSCVAIPHRGADPELGSGARARRAAGQVEPRTPRRHRLPRRTEGRSDPARGERGGGVRRLRGDDRRPALPNGDVERRGRWRSCSAGPARSSTPR